MTWARWLHSMPHSARFEMGHSWMSSGCRDPVGTSEQRVAHSERPIAGRPELRQLGVDVDLDRTEEVDIL